MINPEMEISPPDSPLPFPSLFSPKTTISPTLPIKSQITDHWEAAKTSFKRTSNDDTIRKLEVLRSKSIENIGNLITNEDSSPKAVTFFGGNSLIRNSMNKSPHLIDMEPVQKFSPSSSPRSEPRLLHITI